ncbi:MAG: rhodanese-like domain-containing protein [Candidatus Diapherotrites archaeon]|uniref:Rhodanese-like domain-containing protein n=1 Tax=Candidatus Iainarchaeum sp. TaxID=3101447 RepID=A0A8T3YQG5_9ARCH|nr:rhodanese-like domain-containing protein [Candidatus Diapherotrites archaeon]
MPEEISPKDAKTMLENGLAIALDVRGKEEIEFASIGNHEWIPVPELARRYSELPKGKPIICVCRSGARSASAAEFLSEKGYEAMNLRGGIMAWHREVDNSVRPYVYKMERGKTIIREMNA